MQATNISSLAAKLAGCLKVFRKLGAVRRFKHLYRLNRAIRVVFPNHRALVICLKLRRPPPISASRTQGLGLGATLIESHTECETEIVNGCPISPDLTH